MPLATPRWTVTIPLSEGALAGSYKFFHTYLPISGDPNKDTYPESPGGGETRVEAAEICEPRRTAEREDRVFARCVQLHDLPRR